MRSTDIDPLGSQLPGAPPLGPDLAGRLAAAWRGRDPAYRPRTRHLLPDGSPKYTNRLFLESSPYLRQHAHNPVNWFPWGDEAFELATRLGRPVFLSVGYSTCHWCHVMEEESFDDEEIARFLNEHYVAIKVDREERPDIDAVYMAAVQAMTGRGGWPMSVWLTPGREPFYGGTYFPARDGDRGARVGFLTLLGILRRAYDERSSEVAQQSVELVRLIRQSLDAAPGELAGPPTLHAAAAALRAQFDPEHGGVRGAPKFPSSMPVRLLLRYHRRTGDAEYLRMAAVTLEKMAAGGIRDHVGGGFHRYATDPRWLVPHFEKMLYDNALLVLAYLEGYQATARKDFEQVARGILRDLERDMTAPEGAFYSATDADSPGPDGDPEEGYFFTWTPREIEAVLGPERARAVNAYYAVTAEGNFEGRNILHTPAAPEPVARALGLTPDELLATVREANGRLYEARRRRPAPLRDEKILTAWNGLAISAFARAGLVLAEPRYAVQAGRAASFVLAKLRKEGRLLRSFKDGRGRHNAYLEDYAFLIAGLLDLYEATGEPRWLAEAVALDAVLEEHYEDRDKGGFFQTSDDHERLLAREKPGTDDAVPSGNSVHALNLLRLGELTARAGYRARAERTIRVVGDTLARAPIALSEMLLAVDFLTDRPKEVILVAPQMPSGAEPLLAEVRAAYLPNAVLVLARDEAGRTAHEKLVPILQGKRALEGRPTAYVCERGLCKLPTSDPQVLARQLREVEPLGPSTRPPGTGG
jgi:hypothetical protein